MDNDSGDSRKRGRKGQTDAPSDAQASPKRGDLSKAARDAKLAAELRTNLAKRKQQLRARRASSNSADEGASNGNPDTDPDPSGTAGKAGPQS